MAFVLQAGMGLVVSVVSADGGRAALPAFRLAFALPLALQLAALLWFVAPALQARLTGARPLRSGPAGR